MKRPLWTAVLIASIAVLVVAGTKVSRLTRTTTFQSDSLFMVVTGSVANGTTATRAIEATNLVTALTALPNWPIGTGSGVQTVKSNGVNVTTSATAIDFVTGSNTVVLITNAAGVVTVQVNASASASNGLTNNNASDVNISGAFRVAGKGTNAGAFRAESSVYVGGNETNAGNLRVQGAASPIFEVIGTLLPNTFFVEPGGIGTRSGGGQPYFTLTGDGTPIWEVTSTNIQPVNGAAGGLGSPSRPVTSADITTASIGTLTGTVVRANTIVWNQATNSGLPTNAFMRIGPGGIVTTGIIGSGLTLGADGTLSATGGGGGEANVNGESAVTNATKIGLVNGKSGITNLLRSLQSGNGIVLTNQGTNVPIAIDPAVVASQTDLTGASNSVFTWANSVSNLVNSKQAGSAALTNIGGLSSTVFTNVPLGGTNISVRTAGGTNFIDTTGQLNNWAQFPTNTMNTNALNAVLSFASNQVSVAAGSGITVTPSGSGNVMTYTIAATGGAASTNDVTRAVGSLTITNQLLTLATNLNVQGTNLVANGTISSTFSNAIATTAGGLTNIVFTNILDGQTITAYLWVTNGATVQLCAAPGVPFPDPWYPDGASVSLITNGFSIVTVRRFGGWTNVSVATPLFTAAAGPGQSDSTNSATRTVTRLLSAVLTNLIGTVSSNVTNENSIALQIDNGTLSLSPGPLSNIVSVGFSHPYFLLSTNQVNVGNTTNLNIAIYSGKGVVVSNDAIGVSTLHIRRQGVYRTIYVDAGAMVSNVTAGATFSTEESQGAMVTTNKMIDSYVFDGSTSNAVQFKFAMPLEWDQSTIKVKLWTWSTNNVATTTNVFGVAAVAIQDSTVITNVTWGTEQTITNAVSSDGGKAHLTAATPALTVGNSPAAAGNLVLFRVRRLPGNANDNDVGQQKILGAWIQYKEQEAEVSSW